MVKSLNLEIMQGRFLRDEDVKKVFLGSNFAEDDVFGKVVKVGDRLLIQGEKFQVVGISEKKGSFLLIC